MNYQRQPSTFDRIMAIIGTGLGIAKFVKDWRAQSAEQEGQETQGLTGQLGLAQKIAELTGQPMQMQELGGKLTSKGYPWPRLTPERVTQEQENLFQEKWAGPGAPGDITMAEGGRATPMAEVQRREAAGKGLAESLGPLGEYAPITPRGKGIAMISPQGEVSVRRLPPGIAETIKLGQEKEGTWVPQPDGTAKWYPGRVVFPKIEKTEAQLKAESKAKAEGKWEGTPEIEETDPDTGLPVRTHKRRPVTSKTDKEVPVLTQEQAEDIANKRGKVPSGTKILKPSDPEFKVYTASRNEAVRRVTNDPAVMTAGPKQDAAINELTQSIYQERIKGRGKKTQYQLPQNGVMVPVDKATYDAYQKKWGRAK